MPTSKDAPVATIVASALYSLCRVRHRGAVAADNKSGDGAGLLLPLPRAFFAAEAGEGVDPAFIGVAMAFVWPPGETMHRAIVEEACHHEGIGMVGWREVPIDLDKIGEQAIAIHPGIEQAILLKPVGVDSNEAERRCVRARKRAEKGCQEAGIRIYFPSFSFRTITYKALVVADQLGEFYLDLAQESFQAPFTIFHQRFSTNTAPTWERAQPFRQSCHNGEINTIAGQHQPDARPRGPARQAQPARGGAAPPGDRHRRKRLGDARQRARAAEQSRGATSRTPRRC